MDQSLPEKPWCINEEFKWAKGNKKSFYWCAGDKKKETRDLVTWDMEKDKVLTDIFVSVFTGKCSSHTTQAAEGNSRDWENRRPPTVGEN